MKNNKLTFKKMLFITLFVILILAWLFWAWCWGFFTLASISSLDLAYNLLYISLPTLLWGLGLLYIWYMLWNKKIKNNNK